MSKSLATNAAFNAAYKAISVVFPLIVSVYVSRILMPAGVGEVQFASSLASYFVTFAALGLPSYGVREVSRARQRGDLDMVFSELFILNAISSLASAVIYCLMVCSIYGSSQSFVLHIVFVSQIALNLFNIDWFYQGLEEFAFIAVRSVAVKLLTIVLMFVFIHDSGDTLAYALLLCAGSVGNYFLNIVQLSRYVKLTFHGLKIKRHLAPTLYLLAVAAAADIYGKLNTTLLGIFSTSEATGFYSCGLSCINACLQMLLAVTAVFLPRLSLFYAADRIAFNKLVSRGLGILIFVGLPLLVGIQFVADDAVALLFGAAFAPSASVVRILSLLLLVKGIGDLMCYQVLMAAGKERLFLPSRILGSLVNLALGIPLISCFGENGAAVASVASEIAVNAPLLIYSVRVVKPKLNKRDIASSCCASGCLAISLVLVSHLFSGNLATVIADVVIGAAVYMFVCLAAKNTMLLELVEMLKEKVSHGK